MVQESRVKNVVKQHLSALCESEAADEKLKTRLRCTVPQKSKWKHMIVNGALVDSN